MVNMKEPFDLYSIDIDADPFPYYEDLRNNYPCYWSERAGIWLLSRYDDVLAAAQDWETYSSARGNLIDEIPGRSGNTLGTTDPPRHDRLRAIANAAFTGLVSAYSGPSKGPSNGAGGRVPVGATPYRAWLADWETRTSQCPVLAT